MAAVIMVCGVGRHTGSRRFGPKRLDMVDISVCFYRCVQCIRTSASNPDLNQLDFPVTSSTCTCQLASGSLVEGPPPNLLKGKIYRHCPITFDADFPVCHTLIPGRLV